MNRGGPAIKNTIAPGSLSVIAGTAVIYSWDARAARLRYLPRD